MTLKRPELDKPKSFSGGRDALDVGGSDALLDSEYFEAAAAPSISPAPAALVFAGLAPTVSGQDLPVQFISDEVVTSSADSGSTSITVPADCDCVVIIAAGWTATARAQMPMTTASVNGVNSTSVQSNNNGDTSDKIDLRYLIAPATGAQTFAWDHGGTGAITEGALFIIAYFKNVDAASPILDSDKLAGNGTITMTGGGANDMLVGGCATFDTAPTVTGNGQTSLAAPAAFNSCVARGAYKQGGLTFVTTGGDSFLFNAALILKAETGAGENVNAAPANDTLAIAEQTPTVAAGASLSPAIDTLAISEQTPAVAISVNAAPAIDTLVIAEQAPSVAFGASVSPSIDTLAIAEQAASVAASASSSPAIDVLAITEYAPTVSTAASVNVAPGADSLAIAEQAPSVAASAAVSPAADSLVISEQAASVAASASVAPAPYAVLITGLAPAIGLVGNATAAPGLDSLTIAGQGPSVAASASSSPSSSALAITERAPSVAAGAIVAPAPDALAISELAPVVSVSANAAPAPANDNLAVSGFAAAIAASALIAVGFQALTISSAAASVSISSAIAPAPDALTIAEQAPGVLVTTAIAPASAVLAIATHAPTVTRVSAITATPERTVVLKALERRAKLRKTLQRPALTATRTRVAIVPEDVGDSAVIRWPDKRPNESLDYSLDWSLRLAGDPIASVVWTVPSPLVQEAVAVAGDVTTIEISGGVLNGKYEVTCRVTTTGGNIWEEVAKLWVRNR